MAELVADPAAYLATHLSRKSRVLLINPPVQERRYHWLRWNQPLELLRLSAWLKHKHPGIDVRLADFMLPDDSGAVPKHKVMHTWRGSPSDLQLWHFGQPYESIVPHVAASQRWTPTLIVVSSLTSYWHAGVERLLVHLCATLGRERRKAVKIALYGAYPRFEPEHAAGQRDADIAFTTSVDATGMAPDFSLYLDAYNRPPRFYSFDIEDDAVAEHLDAALDIERHATRRRGSSRPPTLTTAFFNDDICSPRSQLDGVVRFVEAHPRSLMIEGICGIEPRSLTRERLEQLQRAGFRSLFVEHARTASGDLDEPAYAPLNEFLRAIDHERRSGASLRETAFDRSTVTGFVAMGLPGDELDCIVRSTLRVNQYFQAVVVKPFGYSPTVDDASVHERRSRWRTPSSSSAQWFPYADHGSGLTRTDCDNLLRWQNLINKRVKGTTFDFLGNSTVSRLVRETIVAESWKRQRGAL